MMSPLTIIVLLGIAALVLAVGELLLPTHGLLGAMALVCVGAAIIVCFSINRWLGGGAFAAAVLVSPFAGSAALRLWSRSPVGKRIILPATHIEPAPAPVRIGQVGITVTELRPMGECDFGDHRIEAMSQLGLISPGQRVRVVALDGARPTVAAIA